jgi:ubiquinone/menaquinone biosynthesis C-methylase UbiE
MNSLRQNPTVPIALLIFAIPLSAAGEWQDPPKAKKLAPYVSSPQPIAERMLQVANLKAGETVYDLGCGDGRIVLTAAKTFKAKGVGVELSEPLVKRAQREVETLGLKERVQIIQGDMMDVSLSDANVVALYLLTEANSQLKPKLARELKPGARVVSLDFKIPGWKAAKEEKVEAHRHSYTIYLYEMPQK